MVELQGRRLVRVSRIFGPNVEGYVLEAVLQAPGTLVQVLVAAPDIE